jgi:hypothetical protein
MSLLEASLTKLQFRRMQLGARHSDRPHAMIDLFGTPYTDKLHVIARGLMTGE